MKAREIPNAHHSLIRAVRIKDLFPDVQIGKEVLKEIDNKVLILMSNARDRATKNGRKRIFPHDL